MKSEAKRNEIRKQEKKGTCIRAQSFSTFHFVATQNRPFEPSKNPLIDEVILPMLLRALCITPPLEGRRYYCKSPEVSRSGKRRGSRLFSPLFLSQRNSCWEEDNLLIRRKCQINRQTVEFVIGLLTLRFQFFFHITFYISVRLSNGI